MKAASEILKTIKKNEIEIVKFVWVGNDSVARAMATHTEFLSEHLETGIGITKGMQSFNALDLLVPNGSYGPESSEFRIMPDLNTFAIIPYAPKSARFIGELWEGDLTPSNTDARYYLRRVIKRAEDMGFVPMAACEIEFYLLRKEGDQISQFISEKFGTSHSYDLINDFIQECKYCLSKMNVKLELLKKEYGHSQLEPVMRYGGALKAADDAITFKDVIKGVAAKRGLIASFMPKPFQNLAGSGNHLHISLFDKKGENNLFYDKSDKRKCNFSELGYYFIGGLIKHMKGISIFGAPLSNSYKRLLPGSWSPAHVSYGYDNRAAAVRLPAIPPHSKGDAARIEFRLPDPSANAYLALGTALAAGLDGIEKKIDPGEPFNLDPSKLSDRELEKRGIEYLPRTLGEALVETKNDPFVEETLGQSLYREYIKVRESEWQICREQITEWEKDNYLTTF